MKYKDIKTFNERCNTHPDHQGGMITHADIQLRLHEEIAELRHYIEWYIKDSYRHNWVEAINNTAA